MKSDFFWCIIGIIGGIIGGAIVSYFFYVISQKRKILNYTIHTQLVQHEDIKKKFNIQNKHKIYISEIIIKNNGNCVIESKDFIPSKPLQLHTIETFNGKLNKGIFLTYTNNRPKNMYLIFNNDKNNATIQYECIMPQEKIQFTIFHTGSIISIWGKLKDGKILKVKHL